MSDGDLAEAICALEPALLIRQRQLGSLHMEVARTLIIIGSCYLHTDEQAKASSLHREALRIKRIQLGNHQPLVVVSLLDVANVYRRQGDYAEAINLYKSEVITQRFLRISSHGNGNDRIDLGVTRHTMGNVHTALDDLVSAKKAYKEAVQMYKKAGLDEGHSFIRNSSCNKNLISQEAKSSSIVGI